MTANEVPFKFVGAGPHGVSSMSPTGALGPGWFMCWDDKSRLWVFDAIRTSEINCYFDQGDAAVCMRFADGRKADGVPDAFLARLPPNLKRMISPAATRPADAPATPSATRLQNAGVIEVVRAWQEAATQRKLPRRDTEVVSGELSYVLQAIDCHPTPGQVAACRVSFARILETHSPLWDDRHVRGCGRWIAWCAAEAFRHRDMSAQDKLRIAEAYAQFALDLTSKMRGRIMGKIPKNKRTAYGPELDRQFEAWRHKMDARIKGLQDDFLFPAFREPPSRATRDEILKTYDLATMYPNWESSSPSPPNTPDEWYQAKLTAWFRNSLQGVMFSAAIGEVEPRFAFNEFWGYCLHSAGSTDDSMWPLEVSLEPDKYKNTEHRWPPIEALRMPATRPAGTQIGALPTWDQVLRQMRDHLRDVNTVSMTIESQGPENQGTVQSRTGHIYTRRPDQMRWEMTEEHRFPTKTQPADSSTETNIELINPTGYPHSQILLSGPQPALMQTLYANPAAAPPPDHGLALLGLTHEDVAHGEVVAAERLDGRDVLRCKLSANPSHPHQTTTLWIDPATWLPVRARSVYVSDRGSYTGIASHFSFNPHLSDDLFALPKTGNIVMYVTIQGKGPVVDAAPPKLQVTRPDGTVLVSTADLSDKTELAIKRSGMTRLFELTPQAAERVSRYTAGHAGQLLRIQIDGKPVEPCRIAGRVMRLSINRSEPTKPSAPATAQAAQPVKFRPHDGQVEMSVAGRTLQAHTMMFILESQPKPAQSQPPTLSGVVYLSIVNGRLQVQNGDKKVIVDRIEIGYDGRVTPQGEIIPLLQNTIRRTPATQPTDALATQSSRGPGEGLSLHLAVVRFGKGLKLDDAALKAVVARLGQSGPQSDPDLTRRGLGWYELAATCEPRDLAQAGYVVGDWNGRHFVLLARRWPDALTPDMTGPQAWKLVRAQVAKDYAGYPAVEFELDEAGGRLLGELTSRHINEGLAIVVDGQVYSIPVVRSRLGRQGIITGGSNGFSQAQARELAARLNSGPAPSPTPTQPSAQPAASVGTQVGALLTGQIVDDVGQPVPGAHIDTSEGWVAGSRLVGRGSATTDRNGRFAFSFSPITGDWSGRALPPSTTYAFVVSPPPDRDLFPARKCVQTPVHLVLKPPTLAPRRLRFEVGTDVYAAGKMLKFIHLTWSRPGHPSDEIHLDRRYVSTDSIRLNTGRYTARFADGSRFFAYLPVDIDANSPDLITFHRPAPVTFHGRVVDGATGKPLAGAFVLGFKATHQYPNLAMLSADDWRTLDALPTRPAPDDPALKPVARHYVIEAIVRTDNDGRYEIQRGPEQEMYALLAFAKDHLPIEAPTFKLRANDKQEVQVPDIPLFAAGCVALTPQVPQGADPWIVAKWVAQPQGRPVWYPKFQRADDGITRRFENFEWLDVSGPLRVFIPANIPLQLRFEAGVDSAWVARFDGPVWKLAPGETLDGGVLKIVPAKGLIVRVVDAAGKPVPGVRVRLNWREGPIRVHFGKPTDSSGQVHFFVPPGQKASVSLGRVASAGSQAGPGSECAFQAPGPESPEAIPPIKLVAASPAATRLLAAPASPATEPATQPNTDAAGE